MGVPHYQNYEGENRPRSYPTTCGNGFKILRVSLCLEPTSFVLELTSTYASLGRAYAMGRRLENHSYGVFLIDITLLRLYLIVFISGPYTSL